MNLERRISHEGFVSVADNLYNVPNTTSRPTVDVHVFADEICIFDDGVLVGRHVPLEGRDQKHVDADHRKPITSASRKRSGSDQIVIRGAGDQVARRSLDFYDAIGRRLAGKGSR